MDLGLDNSATCEILSGHRVLEASEVGGHFDRELRWLLWEVKQCLCINYFYLYFYKYVYVTMFINYNIINTVIY